MEASRHRLETRCFSHATMNPSAIVMPWILPNRVNPSVGTFCRAAARDGGCATTFTFPNTAVATSFITNLRKYINAIILALNLHIRS